MTLKAYCGRCGTAMPVKFEAIQARPAHHHFAESDDQPWGDLLCAECHYIIATFMADVEGEIVFRPLGKVNEILRPPGLIESLKEALGAESNQIWKVQKALDEHLRRLDEEVNACGDRNLQSQDHLFLQDQARALALKVNELEAEIERLRNTLQRISLGSQNSMTYKEDLGKEARKALEVGV